jgi:RNA polymerase sigma-70 factor (ECF subfamily)
VGDVYRADDLVQECLARALSRLRLWKPGTNMRAWLFTIMHNLFVNDCRRQQSRPDEFELTENVARQAGDDAAYHVRLSELMAGLQTLVPEHREVLLLVGIEGMSYQEVAKVLGVPKGTVMSRLHRGREKLRKWMDGESTHATGLRSVK